MNLLQGKPGFVAGVSVTEEPLSAMAAVAARKAGSGAGTLRALAVERDTINHVLLFERDVMGSLPWWERSGARRVLRMLSERADALDAALSLHDGERVPEAGASVDDDQQRRDGLVRLWVLHYCQQLVAGIVAGPAWPWQVRGAARVSSMLELQHHTVSRALAAGGAPSATR